MRVLVVEDEPLIRMLAVDMLEAEGHAVADACSAAAALRLAHQARYDAAVIDLGLPDLPCPPLILSLLAAQPWMGLVISTGRRPDDPQVGAALAAGGERVAAVLGKPWPEGQLQGAVRRAAGLRWRPRLVHPAGREACGLTTT
jgi:CheY-like chemotaxis protein